MYYPNVMWQRYTHQSSVKKQFRARTPFLKYAKIFSNLILLTGTSVCSKIQLKKNNELQNSVTNKITGMDVCN